MDRSVYVRFAGKVRVFYRFSFSPIFIVIGINDTKYKHSINSPEVVDRVSETQLQVGEN